MASEIEITNRSLLKIGTDTILALGQAGKNGVTTQRIFPTVRDAAVSIHPWNFATERVILAPDASAPTFGWSHAFQKPVDCLRVVSCGEDPENDPEPYREEGEKILANTDTLYLCYIKRVTNTEVFPPYFVEFLVSLFAAELAIPIADDSSLQEKLSKEAKGKLSEARFADATSGTPGEVSASSWLDARS